MVPSKRIFAKYPASHFVLGFYIVVYCNILEPVASLGVWLPNWKTRGMFKRKIFSTAAEPVMEEKLIVNATFIQANTAWPYWPSSFMVTSPGTSHKSSHDSYSLSAINTWLEYQIKWTKKTCIWLFWFSFCATCSQAFVELACPSKTFDDNRIMNQTFHLMAVFSFHSLCLKRIFVNLSLKKITFSHQPI